MQIIMHETYLLKAQQCVCDLKDSYMDVPFSVTYNSEINRINGIACCA